MDAEAGWLGLAGAICAVTGAAGGLGRAIALGLAEAGAQLALLDRDMEGLAATAAALPPGQPPPLLLPCDVSDEAAVRAAASRSAADLGPCTVLVNTAALLRPGALESLPLADWNAMLAVNLTGYLLCAQAFGAQMLRAGQGRLVHLSSIAGSHAQAGSGAYSVSKAGVTMLSRQLALEWGPRGLRSNVVSPGLVVTPMSQPFYDTPGVMEKRSAAVPLRRVGRPPDLRDAVLFLASPRSAYVNGEELVVDGGFSQGLMGFVPRPGHGDAA
jgi:NAD(P)-dependent dehydrogenase (short-subunit alcohol dehydrogenase family)